MKNFLLALQFLTIIPVRVKDIKEGNLPNSVVYFPLVGLLLGLILIGMNKVFLILNFDQFSINILLVISLILLTGGLHLDGLADTFDALLSRRNKDEMLKIMRDSRIGVMGVLGIISIILLKISFLSSISLSLKTVALILMCLLSRWSLVLTMFFFPYARREGKAKVFIEGINIKILTLATIITLFFLVLAWQLKGLLILAIIAISTYLIGKFINNKINGVTGDTLGAVNELTEIIVLAVICILQKVILWII
ncbi:MAG: adenosylcobinamide-GDP ribazoletransferase [Candidatus Omnitrophica bacterium]|nr:adenosylcobinamide-GDP ribazoletransferase [Candidatus Omnitrophota bacterium]MBU4473294.1 adenosylcobinamide-GDP ribazoletransferase [Candidatus Omnitrophota bacterium]MCG2706247.1 adenosylcobinamide-GDP ribazoletransferase [Candidatus Omnitrophota bacterium]